MNQSHLTNHKAHTSLIYSLLSRFVNMRGAIAHNTSTVAARYIILDTTDSYTCSFTEFLPFCRKLYCFSNFKDFNTFTQA